MKNYFKKHFITIITLIVAIALSIIINCIETISFFENIILGLLVLLITTFVFDFNRMLDAIQAKQDTYENHLHPSTLRDFNSVDKLAQYISSLLDENKEHSVDFVSLDTQIRTQVKNTRRPMVELLDRFVTDKNITLRYITSINEKNYGTILNFINKSQLSGKQSFYALCNSTIPFASFYIIDKKYLIIRTPYNNKSIDKHYCIIEDCSMVNLFLNWFTMLWDSSKIIDTKQELMEIYDSIAEDEKQSLYELTDKVGKFFIQ